MSKPSFEKPLKKTQSEAGYLPKVWLENNKYEIMNRYLEKLIQLTLHKNPKFDFSAAKVKIELSK